MIQTIYLPTADDSAQLIQNAWDSFCENARKAGYDLNDDTAGGWLKDGFAAGYCAGWNDIFGIIKDQMGVEKEVTNILKKGGEK